MKKDAMTHNIPPTYKMIEHWQIQRGCGNMDKDKGNNNKYEYEKKKTNQKRKTKGKIKKQIRKITKGGEAR